MALVISIDILVTLSLIYVVLRSGFEACLPLAAFYLLLFPDLSRLSMGGLFDLTTQRLLILLLIVLYFFWKPKGAADGSQIAAKLPLRNLILLQIAWMAIATANSAVYDTSLKATLSQILDFYVTFYIFAKSISKIETVRKIIVGFVSSVGICSVLGAIEAYRGWSVMPLFPAADNRFGSFYDGEPMDRGVRVMATFAHPILFGGVLAMAIPMAIYLLTTAKTSKARIALWVLLLLMFLDIYKTGSRGPWIALAGSLCLLLFFSRNKIRRYLLGFAVLTLIVLVVRPGVWETIRDMYSATRDPDSLQGESYEWRYALYRIAYRELRTSAGRALWGFGPSSFFYLGLEGEFQGKIVKFQSCDSSVVELAMETGCIGLLIMIFLLLKPAITIWQDFRRIRGPSNEMCLIIFVNLCAYYFMMTNVAILAWGQQSYMLWVLIAISSVYGKLSLDARPCQPEEPGPKSGLGLLASGTS